MPIMLLRASRPLSWMFSNMLFHKVYNNFVHCLGLSIGSAGSPAENVWRVSAEPGSERQGDGLYWSLNDKVTGYARVWMTRLARQVSHRLVILGCVCDWTDENVKALTGRVCYTLIIPYRIGMGM
uniref:Uncharacterized protein n=1 Tax=Ananas comosus var. bracteatus TaxID=296719 RepID=A0A6V7NFJ9_ANACO|nr:unnamed protein product [Ananas comosus var. bracteatus]